MIEVNERNSEIKGRSMTIEEGIANNTIHVLNLSVAYCNFTGIYIYIILSHNDKINEILDCIQLQLHIRDGEAGQLSSAKQYGLVLVNSIRVFVHVMRAYFAVSLVNSTNNERVKKYKSKKTGSDEYTGHIFYVNRFHMCIGEVFDFEDEDEEGYI